MLNWLRRSKPAEPAAPAAGPVNPAVPVGTTVYAIGDVHGRLDLLHDLEDQIRRHAGADDADRRVLIYVGDYIDRGFDSRGVVDHILDGPPAGFEQVCLKGNHEDFLLRFLDDAQSGPVWLANGGRETLMSYGVAIPQGTRIYDELGATQHKLELALPAAHLKFFTQLALSHVEGGYLFVHAGVRPGVPIADQSQDDLIWIREEFLADDADHGYLVVHGHTPTQDPELRANRIGIDTGAFATGRLTCLVLSGEAQGFLAT